MAARLVYALVDFELLQRTEQYRRWRETAGVEATAHRQGGMVVDANLSGAIPLPAAFDPCMQPRRTPLALRGEIQPTDEPSIGNRERVWDPNFDPTSKPESFPVSGLDTWSSGASH